MKKINSLKNKVDIKICDSFQKYVSSFKRKFTCVIIMFFNTWFNFQWPSSCARTAKISSSLQPVFLWLYIRKLITMFSFEIHQYILKYKANNIANIFCIHYNFLLDKMNSLLKAKFQSLYPWDQYEIVEIVTVVNSAIKDFWKKKTK